jgi:hypothetical protein
MTRLIFEEQKKEIHIVWTPVSYKVMYGVCEINKTPETFARYDWFVDNMLDALHKVYPEIEEDYLSLTCNLEVK